MRYLSLPILLLWRYMTCSTSFSADIKTASKGIDCTHFGKCPACVLNDEDVSEIESARRIRQYFSSSVMSEHRIDKEVKDEQLLFPVEVPSSIVGWRSQARIAASARGGWNGSGCTLGLYERGSHNVVTIEDCRVHDPVINAAMKLVEKATVKVRINAYDEVRLTGELRYVQVQVERRTGKAVLVLVWNGDKLKDCQPSLSRMVKYLRKKAPDQFWHSIWCHCNSSPVNNIFARGEHRWHLMSGPEYHTEILPGASSSKLYYKPMVFRQANLEGFAHIAQKVAEFVPHNAHVCELYAGIGVIGLTVLNKQKSSLLSLKCSDENPSNLQCFHRSLKSVPTTKEQKVTYIVSSAAEALKQGEAVGADVLIVDPPRKGLEKFVLDQLCLPRLKQKQRTEDNYVEDVNTLIYVSCGYKALLRDCDRLLSSNSGWKIHYSSGYILFPGSDHVESLVVLKR